MPQDKKYGVTRLYLGSLVGLGILSGGIYWWRLAGSLPAQAPATRGASSAPLEASASAAPIAMDQGPELPTPDVGPLPPFPTDAAKRRYLEGRRQREVETATGFEQAASELETGRAELESTGQSDALRVMRARIEELRVRAGRHRERAARYLALLDSQR